jgi:hypothetical protein
MRWKVALPAIGSPPASAARASGADAISMTKSNIRPFMCDILLILLIDVERICP